MKKIVLVAGIVLLAFSLKAQTRQITDNKNEEIVINQKLIDKFNSYELPEDYTDIYDLMNKYEFNNAKIILNAYKKGDISLTSENEIDTYLDKIKNETEEIEKLDLHSEKDLAYTE